MIDPLQEELITPNEATRYYPRSATGKRVHVSKVYRDMQKGQRGKRLEFVRTPRMATSKEAIARFFQCLSGMTGRGAGEGTHRTRARDEQRIERDLDQLGI